MSSKHHGGPAPIPPGNRPQMPGPGGGVDPDANVETGASRDQEQDAQRRLGGFQTKGEHARVQPGALNDGDTHSK